MTNNNENFPAPTDGPRIRLPRELPRVVTRLRARAWFFLPEPPILANSIPKSGTHVLSRLLSLYPKVLNSGHHIRLREHRGLDGAPDWSRVRNALAPIGNGQFGTSHFPAEPELKDLLTSRGFRVVFMVRDPRDMVLSYLFYVLKRPHHFLHDRLVHDYKDDHARLMAIIQGIPAPNPRDAIPSARQRLDDYIDWLDWEFAYTCRFEELIGSRGGGSDLQQIDEVRRIGSFIRRPVSESTAARIADLVWSQDSITFRKGVIGDWREHFTDHHRDAMKDLLGDYLVQLGYETTDEW